MSDFEFHAPRSDDESHEDYVYHATNADGVYGMADSGHMHVHKPWHGTDQDTWPDGSTEKRAYFSKNAGHVASFAPEEGPHAVIRVRHDAHPFKAERYTRDIYTTKKIPISKIEVRHADGEWHPVMNLKSDKSESLLTRTPLILEATYADKKEKSFRGGIHNRHTPREGHWLPSRIQPRHSEGIYRQGPKGKRRKRRGSYLRDEPIRKRAEPIRRFIGSSVDLDRTGIVISEMDADVRAAEREATARPGDVGALRRLAAARGRIGDSAGVAAVNHQIRMAEDPHSYAQDLRRRVEAGELEPHTLRHYREALHAAHPDIARSVGHYATYSTASARSRDAAERFPVTHPSSERLSRQSGQREQEANQWLDDARLRNRHHGHNLAYFLTPPTARSNFLHINHLHQLHNLHTDGYPGSPRVTPYADGAIEFEAHRSSSGPATGVEANEAERASHQEAALIRDHFPNANVTAEPILGRGYRAHAIRVNNVHELEANQG